MIPRSLWVGIAIGCMSLPGYGVDLVDTNIVGGVNTTTDDLYEIDDAVATDFYLTNSSITAAAGRIIGQASAPSNLYARGTSGLKSTGSGQEIRITDSSIMASGGGSITVTNTAYLRILNADGGHGLNLQGATAQLNGTTVRGGDGGILKTRLAHQDSSALGGTGVQLFGTGSFSATNTSIRGGDGGSVDNLNRTGNAGGGAGIEVYGPDSIELNLNDSTVTGGDGGTVEQRYVAYGGAAGGAGLLIHSGASVLLDGGIYAGGTGGAVAGVVQPDGAAMEINDSTVALAGGTYLGEIRLSGGTSTISLKETFAEPASFVQTGGAVEFDEWYDGQLADVTLMSGSMSFDYESTNAFTVSGLFTVAGVSPTSAEVGFNSGLVVADGGVLDPGLSSVAASSIHTESNSVLQATLKYGSLGSIASAGSLSLDAGTRWLIHDIGVAPVATNQVFTLATAAGAITNRINPADVHYVGNNSPEGSYVVVTNVSVVGSEVQAICTVRDVNDNDSDGIDDELEVYGYGTDPADADSDDDGLIDGDEVYVHGTDPAVADSDGDGVTDGDEVNLFGTDPLDADIDPLDTDNDGDGLTSGEEVNIYGTNPALYDTDGDNLGDGDEIHIYGTDPLVYDTDGDGYGDGTLFVRQGNTNNAAAPYTSWATAAANISDALQYSVDDLTILVDDGHYLLESELLVTNRITIRSVNGPEATIIDGQGSVRCFNLEHPDSEVSGLSITGGYANATGGGISCLSISPVITNCVISGNVAAVDGGGVYGGTVINCTIADNQSSRSGGGMANGTANNCFITDNTALGGGGGMIRGTANNCTILGNSAEVGGGLSAGTANNCIISGNSAEYYGGGMYYGTANNCTIVDNSSPGYGGGMFEGTANNCTIAGNSADEGGGMFLGTANNCTVIGNSANEGGGMCGVWGANNCIVWYNEAPTGGNLDDDTTARYTCSPDVNHGADGNITNAPALIGSSHVATNSPCRGAGSVADVSGVDLDGDAWLDPPSMGCDEVYLPAEGPLQVGVICSTEYILTGDVVDFLDTITGTPTMLVWDFGDGTVVTNHPYPNHSWDAPSDYEVVLTAFNDSWPSGVSATQTVHVADQMASAIYVAPDGDDANDGSSWASAKATIQAGVNAQEYGGGLVLIADGTYALDAEIRFSKRITVQGANGPADVIVDGQGNVRCFNLGYKKCLLSGLTITNGFVDRSVYPIDISPVLFAGGGIYSSAVSAGITITNCIISGCTATRGGGVYGGTLYNCTLTGNSANEGGGMAEGTANNCTITGNSANDNGGGMYSGTATNCTISGNSATVGGGVGGYDGVVNNCSIIGNSADYGGGMYKGIANNCIISGNSAESGGGMASGTANNCTITGNSADYGGGIFTVWANNCTITGNSAESGGGMYEGAANNCIVWYNEASNGNNLRNTTARYTCSPDILHGVDGNITNAPVLIGSSHVAPESPCRGAGNFAEVSGVDLDGDTWLDPPSIGCDEYPGSATGPLEVGMLISAAFTVTGYEVGFLDQVIGTPTLLVWDFGDGTVVTNHPYPSHSWDAPADYEIVLTAYNDSWPGGVSATQTVHVADQAVSAIHVAPDGNDANDGSNWTNAKATIQAGVDVQELAGGLVLVADGTYALEAEIQVSKVITVQGAYGPSNVIVDGQGSVRCFNLGNAMCVLSGLTITNGYIDGSGAGIFCTGSNPAATNCIITGNTTIYGGGANWGGGMYGGTAINCTISGNMADYGGGMSDGTAINCTISGNAARSSGGGSASSSLDRCTISGNSAYYEGGGMYEGTANNCIITGNSAYYGDYGGGGMYEVAANNCIIFGNAANRGGGMSVCAASNCTVVGNSAVIEAGGMYACDAVNSIVWYNDAPTDSNIIMGVIKTISYTCSPDLDHGVDGNITNAPLLIGLAHIATNSPCRGAGSYTGVTGVDLDGQTWLNPPSMGCDEVYLPAEGSLQVDFVCSTDFIVTGHKVRFLDHVSGIPTLLAWDFGDGTIVTNQPVPEHSWNVAGDYAVVLTAFNDSWPDGVSSTQTVHVADSEDVVVYVSVDGNDANDGSNWASAKATVQAGVDAQNYAGGLVLVGQGTYALDAVISISNAVTVQGVDGPSGVIIDGQGSVGCFDLYGKCVLSGLTIINGYTAGNGGGIRCWGLLPIATNCVIAGNSANYGGGGMYRGNAYNCTITGNSVRLFGGGKFEGTANNCTISGNSANLAGGGMWIGTANNCTISGNSSSFAGGGMAHGTANNCIVWYNAAPNGNNLDDTTARYTCSPGLTAGVDGNITAAPRFVNFRLQPTSPCINAGNNTYVSGATDLDGNPRIVSGVVDMGAYEYIDPAADYDGDGLAYDEEVNIHGTDPDNPDTDGDGESDGLEVRMGFNPLTPSSSLSFEGWPSESGYKLGFSTVSNRFFTVESRDSLLTGAWIVRLGLEGTGDAFILIDPSITSNRFYRIRVGEMGVSEPD